MPTVHVMSGLPASGKSTLASSLGVLRYSLDSYRDMMGSWEWNPQKEQLAVNALVRDAVDTVDAGLDVVLDNTHLVPRLPNRYRKAFAARPVEFQVHDLTHVTLEECIRRDALRSVGRVGEEVIRELHSRMVQARRSGWRLTDAWMNESRDQLLGAPYGPQPLLPDCVIFDIDGTLALHTSRGPYDLDKLETDEPNRPVVEILLMYARAGTRIILLSGRKEGKEGQYRAATERWLTRHGIPYNELHMRSLENEGRGDDVVKAELFNEHIRDIYNVVAVYDDRDRVVALWRRMTLPTMQVAYGNF